MWEHASPNVIHDPVLIVDESRKEDAHEKRHIRGWVNFGPTNGFNLPAGFVYVLPNHGWKRGYLGTATMMQPFHNLPDAHTFNAC